MFCNVVGDRIAQQCWQQCFGVGNTVLIFAKHLSFSMETKQIIPASSQNCSVFRSKQLFMNRVFKSKHLFNRVSSQICTCKSFNASLDYSNCTSRSVFKSKHLFNRCFKSNIYYKFTSVFNFDCKTVLWAIELQNTVANSVGNTNCWCFG